MDGGQERKKEGVDRMRMREYYVSDMVLFVYAFYQPRVHRLLMPVLMPAGYLQPTVGSYDFTVCNHPPLLASLFARDTIVVFRRVKDRVMFI